MHWCVHPGAPAEPACRTASSRCPAGLNALVPRTWRATKARSGGCDRLHADSADSASWSTAWRCIRRLPHYLHRGPESTRSSQFRRWFQDRYRPFPNTPGCSSWGRTGPQRSSRSVDLSNTTFCTPLVTLSGSPLSTFIDWIVLLMHTQSTYCICLRFVSLSFTLQTDVDYDSFAEPYHSRLFTSLCTTVLWTEMLYYFFQCNHFVFILLIIAAVSRPQSQIVSFCDTVFLYPLVIFNRRAILSHHRCYANVCFFFLPWLAHQQCPLVIIHRSLNFHTALFANLILVELFNIGLAFRYGTSRSDLLHRQQNFTQV